MNAPLDNLRQGLADLADDVRPVDLRDRTLRASKRLGYQRAAVTSTLAIALVAGATGVAMAVLPGRGTAPVPASGSPSVSPWATSSPSVSATPSASPTPTPVENAEQSLPGTFVFVKVYDDSHVDLFTLTGGQARKVGTVPAHADSCAFNSVTVSRDATKVAWVRTGKVSLAGELMVADIDGSNAKLLLGDVACGGNSGPAWSADGRRLTIDWRVASTGGLGTVDVATGKFTKATQQTRYQALSANGLFGATYDRRRGLTVTRLDGSGSQTVPYTPAIAPDMDIPALGISPDGRYVSVGIGKGDPGRVLSTQAVVDMTTGKAIKLPSPDIRWVYFLADGSMMLAAFGTSATVLYHLSAAHTVIAQVEVPPTLKAMLLQYNS
jgi:hypothetical protein